MSYLTKGPNYEGPIDQNSQSWPTYEAYETCETSSEHLESELA